MNACIVGCGTQCEWTSGNIARYFNSIHWVDTDIEKAKHFYEVYKLKNQNSSYGDEVKTDNIDFGIILTPNGSHKQLAQHFIEKNIPVFIEKPLALLYEDLQWFEEKEKAGAWITVGFNCRFHNSVIAIKKALETRSPIIIDCWKHRGRRKDYYNGWHGKWKTDGGVTTQQGIHAIDLVCYITGQVPNTISMIGKKLAKYDEMETEDTALISLDFGNFLATIHLTTAIDEDNMAGGHSGLFVTTTESGFCSAQGFSFEQITAWKNMGYGCEKPDRNYNISMWSQIIDALKHKNQPPVPVSEAVKSMYIAHAAYSSWFNNNNPVNYGTKFSLLGN